MSDLFSIILYLDKQRTKKKKKQEVEHRLSFFYCLGVTSSIMQERKMLMVGYIPQSSREATLDHITDALYGKMFVVDLSFLSCTCIM